MVLHDINLSARYADYIFALRKGKLIAQGKPSEIITSQLIDIVFGLDCTVIQDPVSYSPFIIPRGRHHVNI
jgi:iron complex transport system ATP-binding protein